ncbi:polysaccharide deacetylase family protein [Sphingomonas sp. RP10(2022)]|uniref:Polysaccharide deacetylase family protein n=1 Tax=Sphingomonas liriopis TaxID=2949094 RepID=A0A9X2KPR5_9SPHN|nr:polysaccharide deacetylase family protein [Sphingomonas liriopis]MCP3734172.1 polysaccharide deacetylase family protein [Sphingomonas liriopis]
MKRLFASIHDVSPRFEGQVDRLLDHLAPHVGRRLAMLVVPDHWSSAPITPAFATRLRGWADEGIEMFVHGWTHRDDTPHVDKAAALKARHMTAGEGEFLGLSHAEALQRMRRGKALVEDITGRAATGFIAPAWLYSEGARAALQDAGFALAEDHARVWRPGGAVVARGPVITWASRSRPRQLSSLAAAGALRHVLQPTRNVRIAVHPGDTTVPALMRSITTTFAAFGRHRPAGYAELLG